MHVVSGKTCKSCSRRAAERSIYPIPFKEANIAVIMAIIGLLYLRANFGAAWLTQYKFKDHRDGEFLGYRQGKGIAGVVTGFSTSLISIAFLRFIRRLFSSSH